MADKTAIPGAPPPVGEFVRRLVESGEVSSAVALRGGQRSVDWIVSAGERSPGRAVSLDDRFDLASLTKPVIATLALVLDRQGEFSLDESVGDRFPTIHGALVRKSWRDLLTHRAGFIPWLPLYRKVRLPDRALARLCREDVLGAAPGTYSDLGYIFWALAVERALGSTVHDLLTRCVLSPLGMKGVVGPGRKRGVVACQMGNRVEVELASALGIRVRPQGGPALGEPQDGNARFLGRVCGHAGLFATVEDLWRLGREWLRPGQGSAGLLEEREVRAALGGRARLLLGWRRRRRAGSGGMSLSSNSFGHPGFTGTSLWIDPETARIFVLLAHRTRTDVDMDAHRRAFHRIAVQG